EARRNDDTEQDDRAAHEQDGQRVAHPPEHADGGRSAQGPLAADDGGHGNHVIGVGRVPHPEEEAEEQHRAEAHAAHYPATTRPAPSLLATRVTSRRSLSSDRAPHPTGWKSLRDSDELPPAARPRRPTGARARATRHAPGRHPRAPPGAWSPPGA